VQRPTKLETSLGCFVQVKDETITRISVQHMSIRRISPTHVRSVRAINEFILSCYRIDYVTFCS
jgi:hypothetical protein